MGRRGRRQVLQLSDNSDSFLAKYGYNRQEEDIPPGNEESEEEPEEDGRNNGSIESGKTKENGDHIDDKVADFLAELEKEDSNDVPEKLGPDSDPQVGFKLNPDQKPDYIEPEPTYVSSKARSMYKNMFVKGDSEFTGKTEKDKGSSKKDKEVEWPEEPTTVWQATLDDNTQCFYYWNTVTNDVTWEIPPDYTQYLLQMKSYEEKVDKLKKEGRVKPVKKIEESTALSYQEPKIPGPKPTEKAVSREKEPTKPEKESKEEKAETKPTSTSSSSKTTLSALAAYVDSDADSSGSESESPVAEKKRKKKKESDEDLDLDDIDKALESALEKKKPEKDSDKQSKTKKDDKSKALRKLSLIDSIKEQVKLKQETEARRKAAIEEMMARELERRVGPPRKRSTEEETVWDSKRPKIVDYGHSRSRSPPMEPASRSDDRDSRSRRHDRDRDRESDRHSHKKKKKEKDRDKEREKEKEDYRHRDDRRRDHDRHEKEHKKKDKKKDKERDEKRRDKDEKKEKEEKKDRDKEKEKEKDKDKKKDRQEGRDKRSSEKDSEKNEEKHSEETEKVKDKSEPMDIDQEVKTVPKPDVVPDIPEMVKKEIVDVPVKKELDVDAELESIVTGTTKVDVDLANKKMQACELADLTLSKLEFLEVTKKGLSKLQILLVELETRHQDWQAGGLNTEFYLVKLEEANWQLEQYEKSAAPPGWSCHWDRSYRRYFYMNKRTKQTQWDYPDEEEEEDDLESSPEQGPVTNKTPERPKGPGPPETEAVTSTTKEQEEASSSIDVVSSSKDGVEEPQSSEQGWPNYESVTNYISGTEYSGVIRGEPPPPGTDLELLLTAPPPPPPPPPEEENQAEATSASYSVPGPPEGLQSVETSRMDDIDGVEMSDEHAYQDMEISESNVNTGESKGEASIIARGPQMFSENQYSSYYDSSTAMPEQFQDGAQYFAEGGDEISGAMGSGAMTDAVAEKKKKKKDKQSSGQLKNKNMAGLVQKWQKVKKEVEIEEQQREERQQAIRQKLDEWKKEHS